jgi:hypothetical protein
VVKVVVMRRPMAEVMVGFARVINPPMQRLLMLQPSPRASQLVYPNHPQ